MKNTSPDSSNVGKAFAALALAASLVASPVAVAGNFIHTDAGPYDYNDTANWIGGTINNTWGSSLTADQTITFGADTTLSSSLSISNTSLFNHTFLGFGANRTVTLGGSISLGGSTTNVNRVTIGSTTDGERLNIDLGGATRTFSVGTNRTLELVNTLSGTGGISKTGLGTLTLTNTANTYTAATSIGSSNVTSGTLEVTKLANGGQSSSIGASSNNSGNLVFGGTSTGTLRYVGTGDSTDRRFLVGGVGANFDASGSGAVSFTNTAAVTYASAGTSRTITLMGTNTGANSMSAAFTDSGAGVISIAKTGSGKWILAGTNTNTGATSVSGGTLLINGSTTSAASVDFGAILGGSGTIGGDVTVSGTLAPGASVESLETDAASFLTGSTLALELDSGADVGFQSDLLVADGNVSLGGTVNLTLADIAASPSTFSLGTTFSLVNYSGSLTGLFTIGGNVVADGGFFTIGLNTWQLDYDASAGGTNFTADHLPSSNYVNIVAVPEPTAMFLLAGGLTLITLRRSRRH